MMSQFFSQALLGGGTRLCGRRLMALFTRRELSPPERRVPWDGIRHPLGRSPAIFFVIIIRTSGLYRHLLWIDPERKLSVTLLTNRTWPDCANRRSKEIGRGFMTRGRGAGEYS